jgi:hypothetical protein
VMLTISFILRWIVLMNCFAKPDVWQAVSPTAVSTCYVRIVKLSYNLPCLWTSRCRKPCFFSGSNTECL